MNNEWKQFFKTEFIECHRSGWFGVYDAIKSAITGKDRIIVVKPVEISFWYKGDIGMATGININIK